MALTTADVQARLAALKEVLQDVGPVIASCLTKLVLQQRKPTRTEALNFLAEHLASAHGAEGHELIKAETPSTRNHEVEETAAELQPKPGPAYRTAADSPAAATAAGMGAADNNSTTGDAIDTAADVTPRPLSTGSFVEKVQTFLQSTTAAIVEVAAEAEPEAGDPQFQAAAEGQINAQEDAADAVMEDPVEAVAAVVEEQALPSAQVAEATAWGEHAAPAPLERDAVEEQVEPVNDRPEDAEGAAVEEQADVTAVDAAEEVAVEGHVEAAVMQQADTVVAREEGAVEVQPEPEVDEEAVETPGKEQVQPAAAVEEAAVGVVAQPDAGHEEAVEAASEGQAERVAAVDEGAIEEPAQPVGGDEEAVKAAEGQDNPAVEEVPVERQADMAIAEQEAVTEQGGDRDAAEAAAASPPVAVAEVVTQVAAEVNDVPASPAAEVQSEADAEATPSSSEALE